MAGLTDAVPLARAARGRSLIGAPARLWLARLALLAGILLAWQLLADARTDGLVPSPTDVASALGELVADGELGRAFLDSNAALVLGLAIASVAGVALGIAAGRSRVIDLATAPYLDLAMVIPMVALVPVVIVFLGIGLQARVAVVVLFALPDIAVNVRAGVLGIDPSLLEMARAYGAPERRLWRSVLLPATFPAIMTALRVGIGRAVMGMVVVELTLVASGFGGLIMESLGSFQAPRMWALVAIVALEALVLTALATRAERFVGRRMGREER